MHEGVKTRHQSGYVFRKGGVSYLRYYDTNASGKRIQACRKLAVFNDHYRTKNDVLPLAEDFLRPINRGRQPSSTMTVRQYVEAQWLPQVESECKPSTVHSYKGVWKSYLLPSLPDLPMRSFRCKDATDLLNRHPRQTWYCAERPQGVQRGAFGHLQVCEATRSN